MKSYIVMNGPPEFPVKRQTADQLIPREGGRDWVDENELRRLRREFRGTTPWGREIIRKIIFRCQRKLFGDVSGTFAPGQIAVQVGPERSSGCQPCKTNPI